MSKKIIINNQYLADNGLDLVKSDTNSQTMLETSDFLQELDPDGVDLDIKYNPSKLLDKTITARPKDKIYSTLRLMLVFIGISILIILGALSVGLNLLELNNPEVFEQNVTSQNRFDGSSNQPQNPIIVRNPNPIDNKQDFKDKKDQRRERKFVEKLIDVSFEFIIIALIVTFLAYLIYRNTDWPLVKNKYLLVIMIVLVTLIVGSGFLLLFKQDNRIPRAIRGHRDSFRGRFWTTLPRQP